MINLYDVIYMECTEYISNPEGIVNDELPHLLYDSNSHLKRRILDTIIQLKATSVYYVIKELRVLDNIWIYISSLSDIHVNALDKITFKQICIKYPLPIDFNTFLMFKAFYVSIANYLPYERFKIISNNSEESNLLSQRILSTKSSNMKNYVMLINDPKLIEIKKVNSSCISIIKNPRKDCMQNSHLKKRKVEFDLSSLDMKANKRRSCRNKTTVINIQNCFSTIQERLNYINKSYFRQLNNRDLSSLVSCDNDQQIAINKASCSTRQDEFSHEVRMNTLYNSKLYNYYPSVIDTIITLTSNEIFSTIAVSNDRKPVEDIILSPIPVRPYYLFEEVPTNPNITPPNIHTTDISLDSSIDSINTNNMSMCNSELDDYCTMSIVSSNTEEDLFKEGDCNDLSMDEDEYDWLTSNEIIDINTTTTNTNNKDINEEIMKMVDVDFIDSDIKDKNDFELFWEDMNEY